MDARKAWDAERAALQGRLAEAEGERTALAAREAQACSRAGTLQLQLQAADSARGGTFDWLTATHLSLTRSSPGHMEAAHWPETP